jgi:hypothetical protein
MGKVLAGLPEAPEKPSAAPRPPPIPALEDAVEQLLQDAHLEPVDKVVWLVIRQHAAEHGQHRTLPGYRDIARQANIASVSTVARAVAILRVTRWLSIHSEVRAPHRRFSGQGYRLHAGPAPMAVTLVADPDYLPFLRAACNHHHARVRRVAHRVLTAVESEGNADMENPDTVVERPLVARAAEGQSSDPTSPGETFGDRIGPVTQLKNAPAPIAPTDRNQNLNAVDLDRFSRHQESNSRSRPRSPKTTTSGTAGSQNANTGTAAPQLVYPARLTPKQREAAVRHLAEIPDGQRQAVLDELEGRLRAERHGAKPVYDELSYLRHLCGKAKAGDFEANMGLKVQLERRQRQKAAEQRQRARIARQRVERSQGAPQVRRDVSAQLTALKAALGGRPGVDQPTTDEA